MVRCYHTPSPGTTKKKTFENVRYIWLQCSGIVISIIIIIYIIIIIIKHLFSHIHYTWFFIL